MTVYSAASASGFWSLKELAKAVSSGGFPITYDPYFNSTVLLLNADDASDAGQNNTFLDSSTNAHTITRNGNVTQGSFSPFSQDEGKWGNYFHGDSRIEFASTTDLNVSGSNFTAECWFYATTLNTYNYLFGKWNAYSGNQRSWGLYFESNGTISSIFSTNGGATYVRATSTSGLVQANQWHHIAFTFDTTNGHTIYLDGTSVATNASTTNPYSSTADTYVGGIVANDNTSNGITGYISNARIIKGSVAYTGNFTPSTDPLTDITNTVLLTSASNRFVDISSNGYSATVDRGTPEVTPFSPFAPSTAYNPATKGGSGYFDGTGDYLSLADDVSLQMGSGDFTIEAWIYINAHKNYNYIYSYSYPYQFLVDSNGNLEAYFNDLDNSNSYVTVSGTSIIPIQAWTHVAVVRSGSSFKTYINGVEEASTTSSISIAIPSTYDPIIGEWGGTGYGMNGYIDDFRITKGVALYTSAFTPPTAPLSPVSGTSLLCNFTNAGIYDGTGRNVLETVGDAQVDTAVKKYGTGSMQFDGTGDWLQTPPSNLFNFGTGDFTIEMWAKINTPLSNFRKGIVGQTENVNGRWQVRPANTGGDYFGFTYYNGSTYRDMNGGAAIPDDTWCHLAVVRENGVFKFFIDGVKGTDNSSYTSESVGNDTGLYIMRNVWDNHDLAGQIDDLRITKGVARYTANFTPPPAKHWGR